MNNKQTEKKLPQLPRAPFQLKISVFLLIISLAILITFMLIGREVTSSMSFVAKLAQEVRDEKLPTLAEDQRTFVNIESLRRIAEVAYVSMDQQKRRAARIDAQALAAESIFDRDKEFHTKALHIAEEIATIAKYKDAAQKNEQRLLKLSMDFQDNLGVLMENSDKPHEIKKLMKDFFENSTSFIHTTTERPLTWLELEEMQAASLEVLSNLKAICREVDPTQIRAKAACKNARRIYDEYIEAQQFILSDTSNAKNHWESVDTELRELRDRVSTGSEWNTNEALSGIEEASNRSKSISQLMFAISVIFLTLCLFLMQYYVARPIRWAAQKLRDLQHGKLEIQAPPIHIKELAELSDMLSRFSSHISELYSHTSQLEEDSANKRDLEEVMQAVFMASLDGYSIWNKQNILFANNGMLTALGLSSQQELADNLEAVGFSAPEVLAEKFQRARTKGPFREEAVLRSLSGEPLPVEVTHLPIDFRGEKAVLRYMRDLRQQKQTEEALREAKLLAEEADKAKSDFLARMSHEIRTPMNGVLGLTHLALDSNPPPEQKNFLEKIRSSARILLGVINDILDFSKIEQDKLNLNIAPFSLHNMIQTVMDLFSSQASSKNLEFVLEQDENIPDSLVGDSLRLSQVLLNICGNAIKFTEEGKVILRIKCLANEENKVTLHFSVIDTGLGLSQEQLAQLFKPFSQVQSYKTRKHGGTGLGLVISQRLVKLMGGDLKVESALEKGSNFYFTITLNKANLEEISFIETPVSSAEVDPLKNLQVLLVEDNEINQEIAVALLESMGANVRVANNGQESLDILAEESFDVVLMDIQMPVMDGLTATELIRKQGRPEIRNIPIIAMTAHVMQEDKDKSKQAGMNEHITKPIDINELRDKILHCLPTLAGLPGLPGLPGLADKPIVPNVPELPELPASGKQDDLPSSGKPNGLLKPDNHNEEK